jgi:Cof subfamily protein (haloacid dehalogenase superfamily)
MELLVFDLDGTLLNNKAAISDYTSDTLRLLRENDIAYTVATGRTLHGSREVLSMQGFQLPHIYKNGVMIWQPQNDRFSHQHLLTQHEIRHVLEAFISQQVTPFIFTLDANNDHSIYHPPLQNDAEEKLVKAFMSMPGQRVLPVAELPGDCDITNISAMGAEAAINHVINTIEEDAHLVAYSGDAIERSDLKWIDIHHSDASKGGAIELLKQSLGVDRVICFGDSQNDLSMFAMADEAYAPDNAKPEVKQAATEVIGHHNEDGIARFLRHRFKLS